MDNLVSRGQYFISLSHRQFSGATDNFVECDVELRMSDEMADPTFRKGKGGGRGKRKGVKKEDRVFDDILTTQLEQVMMENDKELAIQYRNTRTTQVERTKY